MKILAALDESSQAQAALAEAVRIAKRDGAELHILSVAPNVGAVEDVPENFVEKMTRGAARVAEKAKELAAGAGVTVKTVVEQGLSPAGNIVAYAKENGVGLIVLGHKGMSNIEKFLLGSVAQNVAMHAPCSVLIVH